MTRKPRKTPTERFQDSFVASDPPPAAADGGPELEPAPIAPIQREPISRCMLGPCRHYHELGAQMDAQQPLDGTKTRLPVFHVRSCYPAPGIEIELELPVRDCSRWEPLTAGELSNERTLRDVFKRDNRELYDDFIRSWEAPSINTEPNEETDASE